MRFMKYLEFNIVNFKAIKNTSVNLTRDQLVLLLGINESGKTSLLKAIEAFDHTNDTPENTVAFTSIRNKKELNSKAEVRCELLLESGGIATIKDSVKVILGENAVTDILLTQEDKVTVSRTFTFENAEFVKQAYSFDTQSLAKLPSQLTDTQLDTVCRDLLSKTPLIIYFEDFKDHIPDYISTVSGAEHYSKDWVSTLEGLFYHADKKVSLSQFEAIANVNARNTALNRVNNALNKQFTARWNRKLKGTKTIDRVEIVYNSETKLFKFIAVGKDAETVFDIDERSKGASWYLTFLLKTEFRKKHLNLAHGQTLYLIDEPGSNLHSTAQTNMVHDFRTLSTDSIVIYTTHSQHLIDKANLSNVYIIKLTGSGVHAERFQDYIKGTKINTTFYQPIIDALEVQPFSLNFAWDKALLVEGISDYAAYRLMFENVLGHTKQEFVIMPGTSASNLETLFSLHIGWGAKIMAILDHDDEGRNQRDKYRLRFPIIATSIQTIGDTPITPIKNFRLEDMFDPKDKESLLLIANITKADKSPSKKELQNALYIINNNPKLAATFKTTVSEKTKKNFAIIFDHITKTLK